MSKMVKVTATKVPTSQGRRTDHEVANNRMSKRTAASGESQKEKTTEQGDVIKSDDHWGRLFQTGRSLKASLRCLTFV